MNKKNLIFITYDGILNPVFSGQVIQPILSMIKTNPNLYVCLVSFEKKFIPDKIVNNYLNENPNLKIIQLKRFSVLGKITLFHSIYLLKKVLNKFDFYSIKARGPLAGWIAMHAANLKRTESFIVQARSLISIEYEMLFPKKTFFHNYRKKLFEQIEKEIYKPKKNINKYCIESITSSLSDYLINDYKAESQSIKIANEDFPKNIPVDQKLKYRNEVRNLLKLDQKTYVYCYNGSSKPWQSLDLTIDFFKTKLTTNPNVFLLILTQDVTIFENLLLKEKIDPNYYKILSVEHEEIYKYLCACDAGIIFRNKHLANWISRPVKAMEYQAAGLKIIHNNTVKWLIDMEQTPSM